MGWRNRLFHHDMRPGIQAIGHQPSVRVRRGQDVHHIGLGLGQHLHRIGKRLAPPRTARRHISPVRATNRTRPAILTRGSVPRKRRCSSEIFPVPITAARSGN